MQNFILLYNIFLVFIRIEIFIDFLKKLTSFISKKIDYGICEDIFYYGIKDYLIECTNNFYKLNLKESLNLWKI
jgi:hypothetical protein